MNALEIFSKNIQVIFNGIIIADTISAIRILETSHPPTFYIPPEDIKVNLLRDNGGRTICEFKGMASYYNLEVNCKISKNAAWSYPNPLKGYELLKGYFSFYPGRVDACHVDGEKVTAQKGDFYGGWITSNIIGPFKGGFVTEGW